MRQQARPMGQRARIALVVMIIGVAFVFVLAWQIHPYDKAGRPMTHQSHVQLGLAPCSFLSLTGRPCPSCGLTTSVSLASHGDVISSLRANPVGTLFALFLMLLIPWGVVSIIRKRCWGVRSIEQLVTWSVCVFLGLAVLRWSILVGLPWLME